MSKKYYCKVSGKPIPADRVRALRILEVPENEWTLKEHASVRPKRGIYMGEHGTSELRLVRKVGNTSVRDVFRSIETMEEPEIKADSTGDEEKDPDSVSVADSQGED